MNERIRSLWTQVCLDEMPELDETCMTLQRQRKFAELIVQEAAAFVSGAAEVYNQAEQDACVRASKGLKKYFGVEECTDQFIQ